jgi:hypothetical protein
MMMSKEDNVAWLQWRTAEHRARRGEAGEVVEDFDEVGKLGQGFSSVDDLEEVDLGGSNTQRPRYVNNNLIEGQKNQVIELLREFVDCFVWEYTEMPGLSLEVVEHTLPIKQEFRPYRQPPGTSIMNSLAA